MTLRYAPLEKTILPKLNWSDFIENHTYENTETHIEKLLTKSISNIEKSNSKITVSLSSGIDSTLVLAILRKTFPAIDIESVSVKFADSIDETEASKKISEKFETNHHILFVENFLEELPKAISIVKLPFWDLHWYHIAKKVKSLSNLFLSGDGGDELFGGYTFRYKKFLNSGITQTSSKTDKINSYLNSHERDWVPDQENLFGKIMNFSWGDIHKILEPYFDNSLPLLSQVFLADFNGKLLYNMVPLYNKLHEFFNIKNISPFLSTDIISYATKIPNSKKFNIETELGKPLLIQLLKKYNVDNLVLQKKQGFSVNTMNLWKKFGQKLCEYYLDNGRIVTNGFVNQAWINKYLKNSEIDVRIVNKFLGLLAFEIWYRLFITHELNENDKLS